MNGVSVLMSTWFAAAYFARHSTHISVQSRTVQVTRHKTQITQIRCTHSSAAVNKVDGVGDKCPKLFAEH